MSSGESEEPPAESAQVPEQRAGAFQRSVVRRASLGVSRVPERAQVQTRRSGAPNVVKNTAETVPTRREYDRD